MKKTIVTLAALTLSVAALAQSTELNVRAFSHRGGRLERDENTILAFQESWDAGYTGFETDIRMTKDGKLFLTHDNTLERTTDGTGVFEEKTAAQIRALNTKKGNKMSTLEEFCKFLDGKDNLYVEFELKSHPEESYPQARLEEMVDKAHAMIAKIHTKNSKFLFTSADVRGLHYAMKKYPDMEYLWIVNKPVTKETIEQCKAYGINTIGAMMDGTSRKMVKKAKEEGIHVSLWPSKSVEDFLLGCYLGSERLCCDVPLTLKKYLEEHPLPGLNVVY